MLRATCIAPLVLALAACAGDPGDPSDATDGGGGGGDVSTDAGDGGLTDVDDPACRGEVVPTNGDPCDCTGATAEGRVDLCDRTCACAGGFWTCNEVCDRPEVVALEFSDAPSITERTGNGDADVNPGEVWVVTGSLAALNTDADGVDVTVRLATSSGRVDVDGASTSFAGLDAEPATFDLAFEVGEDAVAGTVAITVEAFTDDGFVFTDETVDVDVVELDAPSLAFSRTRLNEVEGDGNSLIDAGETWAVTAVLSNNGTVAAEGIEVTGSVSSAALTLTTTEAVEVGVLGPAASQEVRIDVRVADDPGELLPVVQLAATATNATTITEPVEVQVRPPDTLVLDEATVGQADGGGNDDELADNGETWEVVLSVSNSGSFDIEGFEWSVRNYVSGPDEEPVFTDLGFTIASSPDRLTGGASGEVVLEATMSDETGVSGRVLVTARSDVRQHAPLVYEVTLPRP